MPHFMIVLILYINLSKLFLDKKCLFLRNMELLRLLAIYSIYGKCPKISYTKVSDKVSGIYANRADLDETAPD